MTDHLPLTGGVVTIRRPQPGDGGILLAGRDDVTRRFLGEAVGEPTPTAVVEIVGWVDHDTDPDHVWLEPDECNVGYQLFTEARGHGYATRAMRLMIDLVAHEGNHRVATFLIDPANRSQAVAARLGATQVADLDGNPYFKLPIA